MYIYKNIGNYWELGNIGNSRLAAVTDGGRCLPTAMERQGCAYGMEDGARNRARAIRGAARRALGALGDAVGHNGRAASAARLEE